MAKTKTKKREPATPGASLFYAFLIETFGSVAAGARKANLPEKTVTRYVFEPPKRPALSVVIALESIGAQRAWLVPPAQLAADPAV